MILDLNPLQQQFLWCLDRSHPTIKKKNKKKQNKPKKKLMELIYMHKHMHRGTEEQDEAERDDSHKSDK